MLYSETLKYWFKSIFWQPHTIVFISIIFLLLSIPVITGGIAISTSLFMGKYCIELRKKPLKLILIEDLKGLYLKSTYMWLLDVVLILMTIGCIKVLNANVEMLQKFLYIFYLILDIVLIISGIYRWTILIYNKELELYKVYLIAFTLLSKYKGSIIALVFALITFFALCLLTGIGAIFVFPGAYIVCQCSLYKKTLIAEGIIKEIED